MPFGGDGKVNVGTSLKSTSPTTTSLAKNLNNVNIPGLFNASHVQQFGSVNVLVDSPPTDTCTRPTSAPAALAGWDFHDTYFVTLKKAKLRAIGFNPASWKVQPTATTAQLAGQAVPAVDGPARCPLT